MKKHFLLFSLFSFLFSLGIAFAYSTEDVSSANYLAEQNVIVKQTVASKYNLDSKILRQEVISMALKIKGINIPENYKCKKYFADTTKNDWVCGAIEIAADNGIITRNNRYANPGKYVTRAEALAMLMKAGGLNPEDLPAGGGMYSDATVEWQFIIIDAASKFGILDKDDYYMKRIDFSGEVMDDGMQMVFSPNRLALRSEVFEFAKNIVSAGLPKIPEFGIGRIDILPEQLSCVKTEIEVGLGAPLCSSDDYKKNATTYTLFLSALRAKDNPKIAQYGAKLGAYNYGFSESKYRVSGNSFFAMIFGPQSWGSILFPVYTVRGSTIVQQVFSNSDTDYKDWEKAVITKYNLKSLDELFTNDTIKTGSAKYTEILNFANQYWYDRFEKMEIK